MKQDAKKTGIVGALMALAVVVSASADAQDALPARPLTLWYQQPAAETSRLQEGLPIGNGSLGGFVFGGVEKERMVLSEVSPWTGREISTDDYSKMGSFQTFGELRVETAGKFAEVSQAVTTLLF